MRVLLISKTPIITKIFDLVSKKLLFDLFIVEDTQIEDDDYDFIIVDEEFIDDNFNDFKEYCRRLGAISTEELTFDKARDFYIKRPFLPKELNEILKEEFQILKESGPRKENKKAAVILDDLEAIAQNIADDIQSDMSIPDLKKLGAIVNKKDEQIDEDEEESTECTVAADSLNPGGVLDKQELNKLSSLLDSAEYVSNEDLDQDDWRDLSDIIDKAIDEVRDYDFYDDENNNVELILNRFKLDELKPLLNKLNQNIIDNLSNGEIVNLQIRLKAN